MAWLLANWMELAGNALSFACIYLLYRNTIWNWPVGIVNCLFYIALFVPVKLYADAGLQVVYIGLSLYGIWNWLYGKNGDELPITSVNSGLVVKSLLTAVFTCIALLGILDRWTNSDVPAADAATTTASLLATWWMAKRKLENWFVWLVANTGFFFLYMHKELFITAWCQIGFFALSVFGYLRWRREMVA